MIRPCTPPNRQIIPVNYRTRRRGLSAVVEQDEIDEPTQVPITLQDAPYDANFASIAHDMVLEDYPPVIMVFWDDDRHRYEVELSHDQEGVLGMLWDEQYNVCCIFLSSPFAYS